MTGNDELDRDRREPDARPVPPSSIEAFHGLAAAYALDALDADERAEFERALAASPELRDEVDAFAQSAAHLAEQAEPVAPPPSLKADLMARLDATPQVQVAADAAPAVPPVADASAVPPVAAAPSVSAVTPPPPADADSRSEDASAAPASPTTEDARADRPAGRAESAAQRRWFQRPGAIIASAAAAVVLIAGAVIGIGWSGPNGWGAQRDMAAIAEAPDAQSQTLEVPGGGEVTLVSSAEQGTLGCRRRGAARTRRRPDLRALVHRRRGRRIRRHVRRRRSRDLAGARGVVHAGRRGRDHGRAGRRFAATHDRTHRRHRDVVGCAQPTPAGRGPSVRV